MAKVPSKALTIDHWPQFNRSQCELFALYTVHTMAGRINTFALGSLQKSTGTQKSCGVLNRMFFQIPSVVTGDRGRKQIWLGRACLRVYGRERMRTVGTGDGQ